MEIPLEFENAPLNDITATELLFKLLYVRQLGRCFYCNKEINPLRNHHISNPDGFTVDHFISKKLGGLLIKNSVLSHRKCNAAKGPEMPTVLQQFTFKIMYETPMNMYEARRAARAEYNTYLKKLDEAMEVMAVAKMFIGNSRVEQILRKTRMSRERFYEITKSIKFVPYLWIRISSESYSFETSILKMPGTIPFHWNTLIGIINRGRIYNG